jgi:hypothetical protein
VTWRASGVADCLPPATHAGTWPTLGRPRRPSARSTAGDPDLAVAWVDELAATLDDRVYSSEIRQLGRALKRWGPQIAAWHRSRASNGPVEAINNLAKRIKRVAFGITNWTHWRVRVLLYAGRPDWSKLATITPAAP